MAQTKLNQREYMLLNALYENQGNKDIPFEEWLDDEFPFLDIDFDTLVSSEYFEDIASQWRGDFAAMTDFLERLQLEKLTGGMEIGNFLFGNSRGEFPIDREKFQPLFEEFFEKAGIDNYGHGYEKDGCPSEYIVEDDPTNISVKTDVFLIRPYYWGDDESIANLPNFKYGDIEICWYKYALRDAYSNKELTVDEVKEMLNKCLVSIGKSGDIK